jgi:sigma-B regulation protein RsbU (phosphoserine phosphatase)
MDALTLPGTLDSLRPLGQYVLQAAAAAQLTNQAAYRLRLAVDELATNIITHGYAATGQDGVLDVRAVISEHSLAISLEDTGPAHDPRVVPPAPDLERPLEEREVGGLGAYLIAHGVDELLYQRVGERNRSTCIVRRPAVAAARTVPGGPATSAPPAAARGQQHQDRPVKESTAETPAAALLSLGAVPFLAHLSESSLGALAAAVDRQTYEPGEVIFHYGDPGSTLYIVQAGRVKISLPRADGGDVILAHVHAGEMFGELSLLDALPRSAQATALAPTMTWGLTRAAFLETLARDPQVAAQLMAIIGHRLRRTTASAHAAGDVLLHYERDLQIGRQIQASFLPATLPQLPGWEVAARFAPARETAGDWYDAFPVAQGRGVALVIADVSDKGVGAALFMALVRSLIRAFADQHDVRWERGGRAGTRPQRTSGRRRTLSPASSARAITQTIAQTHRYVRRNHPQTDMFVTLFFGVLDPTTGVLIYVNCGHPAPVLLGPAGVKVRLMATGPAVGLVPDPDWGNGRAQIEPGETLFAFTDGVTEARGVRGDLFATGRAQQRLLSVLTRPAASAAALLEAVEAAVHAHAGTIAPGDDLTMLAVRRSDQRRRPSHA